jgi:hypothetical protein
MIWPRSDVVKKNERPGFTSRPLGNCLSVQGGQAHHERAEEAGVVRAPPLDLRIHRSNAGRSLLGAYLFEST